MRHLDYQTTEQYYLRHRVQDQADRIEKYLGTSQQMLPADLPRRLSPQLFAALRVPEEGLEPSLPCGNWILNPGAISPNHQTYQELREGESGEVPVLVPSPTGALSDPDFPPDLVRVVAAWPSLPDAIKAGILALVQAANGGPNA